ncbi:MAG: amidohydrolase [Chloroflexota bacterium]|nr:amidohydrolase [Chloroflexota bacterium]
MSARVAAHLIVEGRIATLAGQEGWGWRDALAIADGRVAGVAHVGRRHELDNLRGPPTVRWRLPPGVLVLPGITDAHLHLMMLALARTQLDLTDAPTLPATLAALAAAHRRRVAAGDTDGWLLGHGWSLHRLGQWPDAAMLEAACPRRPVALYAHDHHSRWVSGRALELAGVGAGTADPEGGLIRRDEAGEPTGILHETASGLVDDAVPDPPAELIETALVEQAAELATLGIVGCHDPGELTRQPRIRRGPLLYRALAERGRLPLRVHASIRASELEHAIELGLRSGDGVASPAGDRVAGRLAERYRMGWLKLFADGSLGSRSAALLAPYSDAAVNPPTGGPRGMFLEPPDELADQLRRAGAAGISGQLHAIGDAAVRVALDLLAGQPALSLRPRIEHAQLVDPADVARFGALRVAASVQPVHLRSDADPARTAWGERSENAFPLAALVAGGALIPFGTDAPVEPPDPWPGIAVAIWRRHPDHPGDPPLGAQHALGLLRAVRAACLDPALVAGVADAGRLTPGCRADLIVVPADGFDESADAAALAATRPLATLIDGEVVHRDARFDP